MAKHNGINGCKNDIGPTLPARETVQSLSSSRQVMRTRENHNARAAAAAALGIGVEIRVHHSGPRHPTSSRRRFRGDPG